MAGARGPSARWIARAAALAAVLLVAACGSERTMDFPVVAASAGPTREEQVGSEVLAALAAPESVTLFALDPEGGDETGFHGQSILATATPDEAAGKAAASSLRSALLDGSRNSFKNCFSPRHGLRVRHGGHVFDFLVCFQCDKAFAYRDDAFLSSITLWGSPEILDRLLKPAGQKPA